MTVRKLSELQGLPVCTGDGRQLGHVHDIRVEHHSVTALVIGARGVLVRLGVTRAAETVPWERVTAIGEDRITVSG